MSTLEIPNELDGGMRSLEMNRQSVLYSITVVTGGGKMSKFLGLRKVRRNLPSGTRKAKAITRVLVIVGSIAGEIKNEFRGAHYHGNLRFVGENVTSLPAS